MLHILYQPEAPKHHKLGETHHYLWGGRWGEGEGGWVGGGEGPFSRGG